MMILKNSVMSPGRRVNGVASGRLRCQLNLLGQGPIIAMRRSIDLASSPQAGAARRKQAFDVAALPSCASAWPQPASLRSL
jgi:hypothetical protein